MAVVEVTEEDAEERNKWRWKIHCGEPSWDKSKEEGFTMTDICDPSGRNQSHVGRVRFPLRAEMHGRVHITDSCFIAFITSKIC